MKKIIALVLAAVMCLSAAALADEVVVFDTTGSEGTNSFVETWAGTWKLTGAYIGAEFAEENDIEVSGLIEPIVADAATMTITASLDASATGSTAGVMVDQAAYLHAHVYDMDAVVTFSADITEDTATLKCPWDGWVYSVPGEGSCDYASSVGKLSKVSADDKTLYFAAITGVENEAISDEGMKYVGMTEDGKFVICYSESNLIKKGNDEEIAFALIFERVVEDAQ